MIHPRTVVRLTLVVCECGFQLGFEILKAQKHSLSVMGKRVPSLTTIPNTMNRWDERSNT